MACALQLTSDINPQAKGQPVTFIAFLSPNTLAGNVQFFADGILIGTGVVHGGQASFKTNALNPGTRIITASYAGISNCSACPLIQRITGATTPISPCGGGAASGCTIQVTSDLNPIPGGQQLTLIAFIQPTNLAGNIQFFSDGVLIGKGVIVNGQASLKIATLPPGRHIITASYAGGI